MGEHARILVIDDDQSVRTVLSTVLEEKGYEVDTAADGITAIEKTNKRHYNLALVDIRLPDVEGPTLIGKLRETIPRMRKTIITGYPPLQNAVEALNRDADAYIMKPFDMDKVLETIAEHLKKQREEKKYGQEKVTEFIQTRVRELETEKTATSNKR